MSVKVMALVWDHFPEGGGMMLTAMALADKASHDGGGIYPAVATVAAMTRQSERSVQYHLRAMEASGWIVRVDAGGGRRNTTTYRMPVELIPQAVRGTVQILHRLCPSESEDVIERAAKDIEARTASHETVQNATLKGASTGEEGCNLQQQKVQPVAPEPSLTGIEPLRTVSKLDVGFADWWSVYPNKKAKPAALRAWRALKPNAELVGILIAAVTASLKSEQWMKDAGRFIPYPATWLNQKRWEDGVVVAAPVVKPHVCQYVDRGSNEICGMGPAVADPLYGGKPICAHHHIKLAPAAVTQERVAEHMKNLRKAARTHH